MENIITIIHILAAAGVIGLVLVQHGKGADMGAAFGSGTSGSLFGVSGSSNILSKLTAVCVAVFFCTSLTLAYMASHRNSGSVVKAPTAMQTAPAKAVDQKATDAIPSDAKSTPALPATTEAAPAKTDANPAGSAKDVPN
jgi:preprotein translocase subunit SecG